jgi:uncharacterized RmlC-like cupin family protein
MVKRVMKVGPSEMTIEPGPAALVRQTAISTENLWAGITLVNPGMVSGWHHHGTNTTVIHVVSGRFVLECLVDEALDRYAVAPGDFVVVPPGIPHNEIADAEEGAETIVIRFGQGGQTTFEVDEPMFDR